MENRLLITGGAGFIGSNFTYYWCKTYPNDRVVVLDALTYAGNKETLADLQDRPNFRFVQGDICDRSLVDSLLQEEEINIVAHLAAESHVDRSILGPTAFVQTNIVGTFTLLEAFRSHYRTIAQNLNRRCIFLHVSTDEVYGSLTPEDPAFTETTPYAPNSPYSASKAGSDHFARAYYHTYGIPTVYGDGQNIRDWLYVIDHCRALDTVIHKGQPGKTYNIGGNNEVKNIDLVQMLCQIMDELTNDLPVKPCEKLITFVKDRPGHDQRYAIDATKIKTELGWQPSVTVEEGLRQTVEWFLNNRDWWEPLLSQEYQAYYKQVYASS